MTEQITPRMQLACPHCGAPSAGRKIEHGRIHCACDRWYVAMRPKGGPEVTIPRHAPPPPIRTRLEQPTRELPAGMVGMGFKLIEYDDGTMFAVSSQWGCTARLAELGRVVEQARRLVGFIRFVKRKQQEEHQ